MEGCEACSMQTLSHFDATATHMHQDLVGRNETQRNECVKSATVSDLYQSPTTCRARNFGLTSHVCLVRIGEGFKMLQAVHTLVCV